MSTIKISQLNSISPIDANTSNTILVGVNLVNDITGKITASDLSSRLYWNNPLVVGSNPILFSNTIAQFSGNNSSFLQANFQNFTSTGSVDVVLTSDNGTQGNNYVDLGINNSQYSDPAYSAMYNNDGYLYVMGPLGTSNSGNLVIGTASYGANVNIIAGGTTNNDIVTIFNEDYVTINRPLVVKHNRPAYGYLPAMQIMNQGNSYALQVTGNTFFAGNVQTTGTFKLSDGTTLTSNTWISANDAAVLTSAKSYTDTSNTFLKSYSVANTTNINLPGDLTVQSNLTVNGITTHTGPIVTGNIVVNGTTTSNGTSNLIGNVIVFGSETINGFLAVNNASFATNTPMVKLVASNTGVSVAPTSTDYILHITGKDSMPARVVVDAFGSNSYPLFAGRAGRGTADAPTNSANNDIMMRIGGLGYANGFTQLGVSRIDMVASEDYTTSNKGSRIEFWNTINGSNTIQRIASFNATDVEFTGVVQPKKGFVYTPNIISGIINSLNIDIANNSLYRFNCNATTTISLSGYQTGKVVEVWMKNDDNNNHTITHGCLANNSTVGSSSFSLTSKHSAYLRYFSIDGDNANTFVSINYS